jgi:hypothetical protein
VNKIKMLALKQNMAALLCRLFRASKIKRIYVQKPSVPLKSYLPIRLKVVARRGTLATICLLVSVQKSLQAFTIS